MRYIPVQEVNNCNECSYAKRVGLQLDVLEIWCTHPNGPKGKLYYSETYPEIPDTCPLPKEKP
jgi:hypothetical protein